MMDEKLTRRGAIVRAVTAAALPDILRSEALSSHPLLRVAGMPDMAVAFSEEEAILLAREGTAFRSDDIELAAKPGNSGVSLTVSSPTSKLLRIHVRWKVRMPADLLFLGDAWERSYGDLAWRSMEPERIMPWYFLASGGGATVGCGVKTNAGALCFWQADPAGVSLWLDVRNGGRGLQLGKRRLELASVVSKAWGGEKPFDAACQFCRAMSPVCKMPAAPVYGGNNWYYAYGKSSAEDIRADSDRMSSLASSSTNRPFMVIDDGWAENATAGPWSHGNAKFPDMAKLASEMGKIGVQPGLWMRPLFTEEAVPESWRLRSPNAAKEYAARQASTLDPTVPEAAAQIKADMRRAVEWGYRLIKHDFSTYDLLGRWGFNMNAVVTDAKWNFADQSYTNAEIISHLYRALREAAGNALVLGCNTVGHLAAGLFEMDRTGDDTSGRDWNRTRKMGVNTLAFRAPQHGAFFAIDADCAGITQQIPWALNSQWLDLLSRSGTPLFVSLAPEAAKAAEIRKALKQAFEIAARPLGLAQPLDWMKTSEPQNWVLDGKRVSYDWFRSESFESDGVSPSFG